VAWLNDQTRAQAPTRSGPPMGLEKLNDNVFIALDSIVPLSNVENRWLQDQRSLREVDRLRICIHKTLADRLHEMLIVFAGTTYVRPSLHIGKEESLYALEGRGTCVFFDDQGGITSVVRLGPIGSGRSFYCRIPADTYHCLLVESDAMLVKETTSGPFLRSDTKFASWSPDDADASAVRSYVNALRIRIGDAT
jgi:cupin fold WbuC family metalloprotein